LAEAFEVLGTFMAAGWYCRIAGEEHGPLTASQLRAMVANGHLSPGDAVRQGRAGVWVPAASVKGLFGAPAESAAAEHAAAPPLAPPLPPLPPPPPPPGPVGRSRPLLRAQPMEDDASEEPASPVRTRLLDTDDAGLDLSRIRPEPQVESPKRARGWRSTGLDFLMDEKSLRATRPKPAPTAPVGGAKDAAEPIRRWAIPILAGVLVLLLIVLAVVNQVRSRWTTSGTSGDAASEAGKAPSSGEAIAPKTGAPGAPAASGQAKGAPQAALEPSGVTWIDATRDPWKCGDVTVKVRAAAITRARLVDATKRVADTQEDYLLLLVELTNNSPTRKIQYTSWSLRGEQPRLTDDLKNPYTMQVAPGGGTFDGQQRVKSIYPEKTAEDLLVFERPVDRARSLRLQLPAVAFGGSGTGYIEIPMSMVKSDLGPAFKHAAEPAAPKAKTAGANGEEKKGEASKGTPPGKAAGAGANHDAPPPPRTGAPETDFGIKPENTPSGPSPPKGVRGPPPPPPVKTPPSTPKTQPK